MTDDIGVGARVIVPFGFREAEGTVVRVSEVGPYVRVTVRLDLAESDFEEPLVTTFDRERVRVASAA